VLVLLSFVSSLRVQLEESERAATRQAKLCSARLHYLQGVDELAQQSKAGPVDFEYMDTSDNESSSSAAAAGAPASSSSPPPPPRKAVRSMRNNANSDMDIDATAEGAAAAASASAVASAAPAASAVPPSSGGKSATAADADPALNFTVTPQMRLDRMFAEHLLRNSPSKFCTRFAAHWQRASTMVFMSAHFDCGIAVLCICVADCPLTAARVIASHPALSLLVDADIFASARRIESSLRDSNECARALAWCGENRSRLAKIGSPFEFDLRLQEFLTLVKQGATIKAIEYARKHLAPAAITTVAAPAKGTAASNGNGGAGGGGGSEDIAASGSQERNNLSQGDEKGEDGTAATAAAAEPTMVADPARVRVLQEAMNLLVFYNFEQEEQENQAASSSSSSPSSSSLSLGADAKAAPSPASPWHKYRVYWSPSRFAHLVREFRDTHLAIYGLPRRSALEYVLNIGLSTIKTSSCTCAEDDDGAQEEGRSREDAAVEDEQDVNMATTTASSSTAPGGGAASSSAASSTSSAALPPVRPPPSSCPACTFPLSRLASSLTVAARTQSRLVCRLSGAVMDDRNPPLVLPNGYVYSKKALTDMAALDPQGRVTCPRTKQTFALAQARIAYVL
jgi:hypothetical protein